jgi:hypothetical protein
MRIFRRTDSELSIERRITIATTKTTKRKWTTPTQTSLGIMSRRLQRPILKTPTILG